jgi:VWFA-related protein
VNVRRTPLATGFAVSLFGLASLPCLPADPEPVDLGIQDSVEVRLVTVDAVVIDAQGRTVSDLKVDDFLLKVDRKEVPIETFDVDCPIGDEADPPALRPSGGATGTRLADGADRRVVLAVDYYHLHPLARQLAIEGLRDLMDRRLAGGEELMVVALANGLRVEQYFTRDRKSLLNAIRRMEHDVSLWNGNFTHRTERPTFAALEALMEVLTEIPGAKALVLFSDGVWPPDSGYMDGFDYDESFQRLAAMAGNARVTLYPVVASGLTATLPG